MTLLRYRFSAPMTVGKRRKRLPSGRVYHLPWGAEPVIDVEPEDVEMLLSFKGDCCDGSVGKIALFTLVPTDE